MLFCFIELWLSIAFAERSVSFPTKQDISCFIIMITTIVKSSSLKQQGMISLSVLVLRPHWFNNGFLQSHPITGFHVGRFGIVSKHWYGVKCV